MEDNKIFEYKEKFFFRTRIHTLTNYVIRTRQNDFFNSSDITTKIEELGNRLQYKSDLRLFDIFASIVFLIIGFNGLYKSTSDSIVFAVSIILIFSALYWIVTVLFHLKYVGSFYFSDYTEKPDRCFEIKSIYPPSEDLELFLNEIRSRQCDMAIEHFIRDIEQETSEEVLHSHATYLKHTFDMSDSAFDALLKRIYEKIQQYN